MGVEVKDKSYFLIWNFLLVLLIIFSLNFVSSAEILDELHLNIQTTDGSGNVVTGTFNFEFNISTDSSCTTVVYSNSTTLSTDSRGIISYYLENTNLDYDEQYYLCYYRDTVLIETSKIARTPYSFTSRNTTISGLMIDSNLNMGSYNVTAQYFFGDGSKLTGINVSEINLSAYVPYLGSDKNIVLGDYNLSIGTDDFFVDATTGRVGIGLVNPTTPLEVNVSTGANIQFTDTAGDGTGYPLIKSSVSDLFLESGGPNIQISDNLIPNSDSSHNLGASNRYWSEIYGDTIYTTGNIGIATTSPQTLLHLYANDTSVNPLQKIEQGWSGDAALMFDLTGSQNWTIGVDNSRDDSFIIAAGNELFSTPKFTIETGGNVGINTTTPQRELHVNGDILSNATINATGDICIEGGTCLSQAGTGSGNVQGSGLSNRVAFWTGTNSISYSDSLIWNNKAKILGIGTDTPTGILHLNQSTGTATVNIQSFDGGVDLILDSGMDGGAETSYVVFNNAGLTKWNVGKEAGDNFIINDTSRGSSPFEIVDNGNMYLLQGGGNVGIGTDNPIMKLHINLNTSESSLNGWETLFITNPGSTSADTPEISFEYGFDGVRNQTQGASMGVGALRGLYLYKNSLDRLRIDNDGNVLIQGVNPSTSVIAQRKLHVDGDILSNATINATVDICIEGGNCLSNIVSTEADPFWSSNYTAYNDSWTTTDSEIWNVAGNGTLMFASDWNVTNNSYVPYVGSSANVVLGDYNFSVGTSDFFVNANTGNVGIGTASPASLLNLNGSAYNDITQGLTFSDGDTGIYESSDDQIMFNLGGVTTFRFANGLAQFGSSGGVAPSISAVQTSLTTPVFLPLADDTNTGLGSDGADKLSLITSGASQMVVDSTGKVGIGTTSPQVSLHINGTDEDLWVISSSNDPEFVLGEGTGAGQFGGMNWNVGNDRLHIITQGNTNQIVLDQSTGNVGINTTNPGELLEVEGNILIGNDSTDSHQLLFSNSQGAAFFDGSNRMVLGSASGRTLAFRTGGFGSDSLTRLLIDNTGQVGINQTTPTATMHVTGDVIIEL